MINRSKQAVDFSADESMDKCIHHTNIVACYVIYNVFSYIYNSISNLRSPQPESVRHEGVLYRLPYCSLVHLAMARRTSSHSSCSHIRGKTDFRQNVYIHND